MTLSLVAITDQITAKLNELNQDVYENGVPDDAQLKLSNGRLLPFIVVRYSGYVLDPLNRGITGAKNDLGRSYVTVGCFAPTERASRQVADLVLNKLTDFQPTNAGTLEPDAVGRPYVVNDVSTLPTKYVTEVSFMLLVNTVLS